jgi:signal transduction histidine kinase
VDLGQVHKDLKLSQLQLNAVFEQAPVALAVVSMDDHGQMHLVAANSALMQMLNPASSQTNEIKISALFDVDDYQQLSVALKAGRETILEMALRAETAPGLICRLSLAPLSGCDSLTFIFVFTDISAQKVHEAQLLEVAGIEQREDFIATLTHDLKTPIVGANMVLTALMDGTLGSLSQQQSELIDKLRTSNQALLKMIHNLLEVYKYESGTESLAPDVVDLVSLVRFTADDVRPLLENKSQTLEMEFGSGKVDVICDRYAIQRVLVNLLGNAIKFTPTRGKVTVCVEDGAPNVIIKVIDTGSGINPGDQHQLFQRFWQGEPGKRYAAGTGLGLYFCRHVVRAHGGTINCESTPGAGSTFTISLPKVSPGISV